MRIMIESVRSKTSHGKGLENCVCVFHDFF